MNKTEIYQLNRKLDIPYDLLLLADPSHESVADCVERGSIYVIDVEGRPVGVYVLINTRPFTMELVNIAVDEGYQGNGIGKMLVEDAIERVKRAGYKTIEVGTGNSSISQLALYQKCGFRIKSIERDYFVRYYEDEILENGIQCRDMIRLSIDFV
ncbi:GNAT family N-acetyltransferase [Alkaliphilus transvaalensis]|uniref:GNAT family N-acetyltransferase n=1 Tax=Alkaliphilus transvaalensis TaxID=114628 RepID=UPI0004791BA3|nr:GNAT family N-acetyltransferase [Alkaliphilus transvaalensis]